MNPSLEEQLKNLIDEAERLGAPAVHTVLNLLLAAHRNGTHHKFARHCCAFSSLGTVTMQIGHGASRQVLTEFGEPNEEFWGRDVSNSSH